MPDRTGGPGRHAVPLRWRILLAVFALVALVCWLSAGMILRAARQQRIEQAFDSALSEHRMLRESIRTYADSYLLTMQGTATMADDMLRGAVASYARYYTKENTALRLLGEAGNILYLSASGEEEYLIGLTPPEDRAMRYALRQNGSSTYVCVSSRMTVDGRVYRFDSMEDITAVVRDEVALARRIALLLLIAMAALLIVLHLLLRTMLAPLRMLGTRACEIARGRYDQRAPVRRMDEVGHLAADFNNMAEAVEEKIQALSETARARALFAANMAHELKTPITSIVGYSDLAQRLDVPPERLQRMMAYINTEAKRLDALSEKLLHLSDLAERSAAAKRPVRADRLLDHVGRTLQPLLAARGQRLCTSANGVSTLLADEALLISLLVNLCQNAAKASPDGAAIRLVFEPAGDDGVRIDVIDEGIGIAAEDLARVREPFYMADKARSRAQEGVGLGLALCEAIVRAHGGGMDIESRPGNGTRVRVTLPA